MESFSVNASTRQFHQFYILNLNLEGLTTAEVKCEHCHFPFKGLRVYYSGGNSIKEFNLIVRCPVDSAFSKTNLLVFGICDMCFIIPMEADPDYHILSQLISE